MIRKIHQFIDKILFLEKRNIFTFKGLKLYPSEIHLILVMSEKPTNATQMSQMLNVTKGAVSQTISRLEKKGILIKTKDPYLKNELTLTFTPLGKQAFRKYKQVSDTMNTKFQEMLSSFDHKELVIIDHFLDHLRNLPDEIKKLQD